MRRIQSFLEAIQDDTESDSREFSDRTAEQTGGMVELGLAEHSGGDGDDEWGFGCFLFWHTFQTNPGQKAVTLSRAGNQSTHYLTRARLIVR